MVTTTTSPSKNLPKTMSKNLTKTIKTLISGTISAFIARMSISPLERVILLKQTNKIFPYKIPGTKNLLPTLLYSIFKKEGLNGVFKGNGMNILRVVPVMSFEFMFYDLHMLFFNKFFSGYDVSKENLSLVAGCFGGGWAYTVVYPIDFSRTMLALDGVPKNVSFWRTFYYLQQRFGFFNMFKGLSATWLGIFPYTGLKFYFFELFKKKMRKMKKTKKLTNEENFICGGGAGGVACVLTYPLDVLRRRRQIQLLKNKTSNFSYLSLIEYIYRKQGIYGFTVGINAMLCKMIPLTAIAFMVNEYTKKQFGLK